MDERTVEVASSKEESLAKTGKTRDEYCRRKVIIGLSVRETSFAKITPHP